MRELNINSKKNTSNLLKVILNDRDEFIVINPNDSSFPKKYAEFIDFLESKQLYLEEKAKEYEEKFKGKEIVATKEDGTTEVDTEQIIILSNLQTSLYEECVEKIDVLFGDGTVRKYFRDFYEINKEFIPDEQCIDEFITNITPVLQEAYNIREDALDSKYSKSRKGSKKYQFREDEE
jgi:predicted metal-dependent hydrolase